MTPCISSTEEIGSTNYDSPLCPRATVFWENWVGESGIRCSQKHNDKIWLQKMSTEKYVVRSAARGVQSSEKK